MYFDGKRRSTWCNFSDFDVVGDACILIFDSSKNNFKKLPSSAINKELNISKNKSDIER